MPITLLALLAVQGANVRWHTDYDAAVTEARRSDRPLLIFSSRGACPNCRVMEGEIHALPAVRELLANFVCVKVDADNPPEEAVQHLSRVEGRTLPFYAFTTSNGKFLGGTSGYRKETTFKADLDNVLKSAAPKPPPKEAPKETPAPKPPPPPPEDPPLSDDELDAAVIKAQLKIAQSCLKSGMKEKAAAILQDVIKSNPRSPLLPEARKLLEEALKK